MKPIIVINDGSAGAEHAAIVALGIAQKLTLNLLVASVFKHMAPVKRSEYVLQATEAERLTDEPELPALVKTLNALNNHLADDFKPEISFIDAADFSINDLVNFINKNNVGMMVKGAGEQQPANAAYLSTNIQSVLNRVACPLLLVPEKCLFKGFERMAYMTDMRYCQVPVMNYLAKMASNYKSKIQVAHISAKGLPDMDESYAHSFFSDVICRKVYYNKLFFNNIKEKNLQKIIDVLIHGMKTDLLVLINHQFHFDELIGAAITNRLPACITAPVMIFPC